MTVRELTTKLGYEVDEGSVNKAERRMNKFKTVMKVAAVGILAGIGLIGAAAIKAAGDMEMLQTQFEVMLGSTEKAANLMEKLKTFAAATPFALEDLAKGTQNLVSAGFAVGGVIDMMRMIGDTAGGSNEKLAAIVRSFQKIKSTGGKVTREVLDPIAERGIPIYAELEKIIGKTDKSIADLVSTGKITEKHIIKAFQNMTSEGGMFFKGMEIASLTFQGLVSTMKDVIKLMAAEIGNTLLPVVKELIKTITQLVEGPLGDVVKSLVAGLAPILETVSTLLTDVLEAIMPVTRILASLFEILTEVLGVITKLAPLFDFLKTVLNVIADVLEGLTPGLNVLIGLFTELVGILLEIMATSIIDVLEPLGETLAMMAEILSDILVLLNPMLRLVLRLGGAFTRLHIKALILPLRVMAKLFSLISRGARTLVGIFTSFLKPAIDKITESLTNVINKIKDFIDNIIGRAIDKISELIEFANKLPFIEIKTIGAEEDAAKSLQKAIDQSKKVTNIRQQITNQINAPVGAPGVTGMTPGSLAKATAQAAKAAFSLELRKVLISAG